MSDANDGQDNPLLGKDDTVVAHAQPKQARSPEHLDLIAVRRWVNGEFRELVLDAISNPKGQRQQLTGRLVGPYDHPLHGKDYSK
jgi:hypothetical protein